MAQPSMHIPDNLWLRVIALAVLLGLIWFVWLLDFVTPGPGSAAGAGIVPRTWGGLDGIPVAPFIHANLDHVVANSIPILILGALVLLRGVTEFLFVVLVSSLLGGAGTWLFGSGDAQHVGASGLVFGMFGYLVFRTAFDRRLSSALITFAVAALYGTAMVYSLIPRETVSWSSHFFGFVAGVVAARWRYPSMRISARTRRIGGPGSW